MQPTNDDIGHGRLPTRCRSRGLYINTSRTLEASHLTDFTTSSNTFRLLFIGFHCSKPTTHPSFRLNFTRQQQTSSFCHINMSTPRVALVTGANKGIGFSIVKHLANSDKTLHVILTARSESRGKAAVQSLHLSNVLFHQLDVTDHDSIQTLKTYLEHEYGGLDILVQNAGRAWKGDVFNDQIAKETLDCNFWGVVRVWEALRNLVRKRKGRVIHVSSMAGNLGKIEKKDLSDQFVHKNVTSDNIKELMTTFVNDVKNGIWRQKGWPRNTYSASKIGLTAITRVWAREEEKQASGVTMYACCPGWVRTDMGGPAASKSPDEGADTPFYLATTSDKLVKGGFYADRQLYGFTHGPWRPIF